MKNYRVATKSKKFRLNDYQPGDTGSFGKDKKGKAKAKKEFQKILAELTELQEKLYASSAGSLLVVLQAMDTGGKDSTIRSVFSPINPQGCRVWSFKKPTELELSHHFLWRVFQKVPAKGMIGIFNRSHYEDVLITRVHGLVSDRLAKRRFEEIKDFEKTLSENGTRIVKFYLHISKEEQKRRLQDRLDIPKKHWKFNPQDLQERSHWDRYLHYYEEAIQATSTREAPWYVIPANNKWYRDVLVAKAIREALETMKLKFPPPPAGLDFKKIKIH